MKSLARVFVGAALAVVLVGLLTVATYNVLLAGLLWPGFLLVDAAASHLGFYELSREYFSWEFISAMVINVILYALLFILLRRALVLIKPRSSARKPEANVT